MSFQRMRSFKLHLLVIASGVTFALIPANAQNIAPAPVGFNRGPFAARSGSCNWIENDAPGGSDCHAHNFNVVDLGTGYTRPTCAQACDDNPSCAGAALGYVGSWNGRCILKSTMDITTCVVTLASEGIVTYVKAGSNACQTCIAAKGGTADGYPYNDWYPVPTIEHGQNVGKGCPDKFSSYVDFQNFAPADNCFVACPVDAGADVDAEGPPCGTEIWEVAEDRLITKFEDFKQAYNSYTSAHVASATANSTYVTNVSLKNAKAAALHVALKDLIVESDDIFSSIFTRRLDDDPDHDTDYTGLDTGHTLVAAVQTKEDELHIALTQMEIAKEARLNENQNLRESIFQLELARLHYRDALYREVWSRDYACAIFTDNQAWTTKYGEAQTRYQEDAAKWQADEDASALDMQTQINTLQGDHNQQLQDDRLAQAGLRTAFWNTFTEKLDNETIARASDISNRERSVSNFLVLSRLRLALLHLFADHAPAFNAGYESFGANLRSLSDSAFNRLLSSSAHGDAQLAEIKARVRSALIKTLKLDPDTSAVEVLKMTPVSGMEMAYDVDYEIHCGNAGDVQRIVPAISGAGKPLFQKVMQGNIEIDIAQAKEGETALDGVSIRGITSQTGSMSVTQRSSASSARATISGAAGKYANRGFSFIPSIVASLVTSLALLGL